MARRRFAAPAAFAPLPATALLAALTILSGCGSGASTTSGSATTSTAPAYALAPYTHQQNLVAQGAHLFISDGCSACHLNGADARQAPSFTNLAGHRVALADGGYAVANGRFLHEALLHPASTEIAGYDPAPMIAAVRRLHLDVKPGQVDALVAFMEQIGPETEE
ncbi:MAG TPA: c-type cytochrome [Solirubrobacteraceae bacterium]|nr:c-type cytochrome [Solirubrobacteraceae bacterium]